MLAEHSVAARIGFELELLAPPGSSRRTLADDLARRCGGSVRPVWHEDSEPAPEVILGGRFLHLTQGFEVLGADGRPVATLVDDVTIAAGLDSTAAAPPGWHRILTDEPRILHLLARHIDPAGPLDGALDQVAALFGEQPERLGSIWRLDAKGATVALALPAGGERERPCEVVTVPITERHRDQLDALLAPARELGFVVPQEAAVHLHVDGGPFRTAPALANLVRLFAWWREPLRELLATNPNCRRLAPLPAQLVQAAAASTPTIEALRQAAADGGLTKFFDVNLTQVLRDTPIRDTVEVRILPGSIDADDVVGQAALIERLLDRCLQPEPISAPASQVGSAVDELRALAGS